MDGQSQNIVIPKKYFIIGMAAVILIGAGIAGYFAFIKAKAKPEIKKPDVKWVMFQDTALKIQLSYPDNFTQISLSDADKTAKILLKLERSDPQSLMSLRYEEGLGMLKAAGGSILDKLVESINRQYPSRYPDFKKEKYEELIIGNEKAAQFYFTYLGADQKTRIKQRFTVVVKDTTGYYLSFQAPEVEFEKSAADFEKVVQSFVFTQ